MFVRGVGSLFVAGRTGANWSRHIRTPPLALRSFSSTGRGGPSDEDGEEEERLDAEAEAKEAELAAKDPFGFLALKERLMLEEETGEGEGEPHIHPVTVERMEEEMERRGAVKLNRNVFGLDEVPKEMVRLWEKGMPPPHLMPRTLDEDEEPRGSHNPEDLYWPANLTGALPVEDRLVPSEQEPVYTARELKEIGEENLGGVCEGRKQRRGKFPLLCHKVDLEELHFTNVPLLFKFITPSGHIKPKRLSGLCSRCQRHVASTVKRARHMGMLPHTMGIDIYKRIDVQPRDDDDDDSGPIVTTTRQAASVASRVKKLPSRTI